MIAWTLAGIDSGGGAGIAADLRTFAGIGVHGCSVVCALTAQNSTAVTKVEYPSVAMVRAQMRALATDLPPRAIKTGMLGSAEILSCVSEELASLGAPVICDPVLVSSSGRTLLDESARAVLVKDILPQVHLLTPNLPEVEALIGTLPISDSEIEAAACQLRSMGPQAVFIKGGHQQGDWSQDYYQDASQGFWISSPRQKTTHGHGTGCTLASAIAGRIAYGDNCADAVVWAKAFLNEGLARAVSVGSGPGPVVQGPWPTQERYLPILTTTADGVKQSLSVPDTRCRALGFYPLVDRASWLRKLLPLGVTTAQLRIKDLQGEALEQEIAESIALARKYDCRLFINDYWELAIRLDAYGVHLGQEDLDHVDLGKIAKAGLRLGVSTHGAAEIARVLPMGPSYIAVGPIYATGTKDVGTSPRGLQRLERWCRLLSVPVVAIGGIDLERAPSVIGAGAEGIAVISAITAAPDPEATTRRWLDLWS